VDPRFTYLEPNQQPFTGNLAGIHTALGDLQIYQGLSEQVEEETKFNIDAPEFVPSNHQQSQQS
jgi:hypothetical protein